ncbi:MAG: hypothetical protein EHM60_11920 [Lysobacterales bacterium]|jgi:hypothetical protein|nr:MAG: hypothetical protein EHM60_11920 [Xanthomonadales bacterium]
MHRTATPTRRTVRLLRWIVPVLAVFGLTGCGLGLVYPRLDTVVGFYLEGLVTLEPEQSAELKRILAGNLEWHRRSELGDYSAFLREVAATVGRGSGREDWLAATRRTEQYWREVFEQAAPGYARLAATFTDAQVRELLESLERADEKERREYASRSPAERDTRREKSMRRAIERFTGPLTPAQRELLRKHVAASPSFVPEWLENRRVWREALADALEHRGAGAAFASRMQVLVARPDELWTPEYRAAVARRRDGLVDLMAGLDATLTPAQRAAAQRELLALADEVQDLARRRG